MNGNGIIARPRAESDVRMSMLSKGQVEKHYRIIAAGVAHAYGDVATAELVTNVMADIVAGHLQVWLLWTQETRRKLLGVLTTSIITDRHSRQRTLIVNTLANFGRFHRNVWFRHLDTLSKFAKMNRCVTVQFDAVNKKVVRMAGRMGFREVSARMEREV